MIDILLYSHHLPAWYCIHIVRRNSVLVTCGSERVNKLFVQAYYQYLYGDPIWSLVWQRISKELSIIRETSFSQCHSTIFRQFIGVKKYLCFTVQRVLDIQNTTMYINRTSSLIKYQERKRNSYAPYTNVLECLKRSIILLLLTLKIPHVLLVASTDNSS